MCVSSSPDVRGIKPVREKIRVNGHRKMEGRDGNARTWGLHLSWSEGRGVRMEGPSVMAPALLASTCVLGVLLTSQK